MTGEICPKCRCGKMEGCYNAAEQVTNAWYCRHCSHAVEAILRERRFKPEVKVLETGTIVNWNPVFKP